jgi:magnesium chelatase family protein
MLVAAMNPCRCGQAVDPRYACKRGPIDKCSADYESRISGPLMDRIGLPQVRTNAEAPAATLEAIAQPDAQGLALLRDAAEAMRLSARGYHRVLRVARTLADLDGAEKISRPHLAEALSYRALAEDLRLVA